MGLQYDRSPQAAKEGKYALVLQELKGAQSVLEIGCHTGYLLEVLKEEGIAAEGIDIDPQAVSIAKTRGIPVEHGDIEDPSFLQKLKKFEVVLLMDVLEHLRDPEKTLKSLSRILEGGGRALVTVPNITYWAVRKDLLLGRWKYVDSGILDRTHLRFNNLEGWKEVISNSGFQIKNFKVADAMLFFESRLFRLPLIGTLAKKWKKPIVERWPGFFAISFYFEITPTPP